MLRFRFSGKDCATPDLDLDAPRAAHGIERAVTQKGAGRTSGRQGDTAESNFAATLAMRIINWANQARVVARNELPPRTGVSTAAYREGEIFCALQIPPPVELRGTDTTGRR